MRMRPLHEIQCEASDALRMLGIPNQYVHDYAYRSYVGKLATSMASLCETKQTASGELCCALESPSICDPLEATKVCALVVETGWHPYAAYPMFFRLLSVAKEIAKLYFNDSIVKMIDQEIITLKRSITFHHKFEDIISDGSPSGHDLSLQEFCLCLWGNIPKTGESLILNIGASDHAIYLEFYRDVTTGAVHVTVFNLGALAVPDRDDRLVSPKLIILNTRAREAQFKKILCDVLLFRRQESSIYSLMMKRAFAALYGMTSASLSIRDFKQITDNCVWRGYYFYLKNVCARNGEPERELMNYLFGAICHMMQEVDSHEMRVAYNILQIARGVTRTAADSAYSGLETCSAVAEWGGPKAYEELSGVGCDGKRAVTASIESSVPADLRVISRPVRVAEMRASFFGAFSHTEEGVLGNPCGGYVSAEDTDEYPKASYGWVSPVIY